MGKTLGCSRGLLLPKNKQGGANGKCKSIYHTLLQILLIFCVQRFHLVLKMNLVYCSNYDKRFYHLCYWLPPGDARSMGSTVVLPQIQRQPKGSHLPIGRDEVSICFVWCCCINGRVQSVSFVAVNNNADWSSVVWSVSNARKCLLAGY